MSLKIGLIGAPGAGKDTFADFLVKHKDFKKLAFADQIKKEYYQASSITEEHFKSVRGTEEEQTIRNGLWAYSDEMRKKHGNLHFITPVIKAAAQHEGNVVVTDIRTKDEFKQLCNILQMPMVVVVRELKLDSSILRRFPGTRLDFLDIMGMPVLWNYSKTIEAAHEEFKFFYDYILHMF